MVIERVAPGAEGRPLVLGHRGASEDAPENTLAAFRLAVEQGADGVELDVWRCRSGEVVVVHDEDARRVAGSPLRVPDASLPELRALDVGTWKGPRFRGERIPRLLEVLEALPGAVVNVELKSRGKDLRLAGAVAEDLARAGAQGRVIVSSFDFRLVSAFRLAAPEVPVGLLFDGDHPWRLRTAVAARLLRAAAVHPARELISGGAGGALAPARTRGERLDGGCARGGRAAGGARRGRDHHQRAGPDPRPRPAAHRGVGGPPRMAETDLACVDFAAGALRRRGPGARPPSACLDPGADPRAPADARLLHAPAVARPALALRDRDLLGELVVEPHDQDRRRPLADEVAELLAAGEDERCRCRHRPHREPQECERRHLRRLSLHHLGRTVLVFHLFLPAGRWFDEVC